MENTLIVGAGGAGKELLTELKKDFRSNKKYLIRGFVDDDLIKKELKVLGLPVLGTIKDLPKIIKENEIQIVFIAIPSAHGELIKKIISKCRNLPVIVKIVPRISEIINGKVDLHKIREIQTEDLLGRELTRMDFSDAKKKSKGKKIIVFGGAGSIGSKLCEQLALLDTKELLIVDFWENGLYYLEQRMNKIKNKNNKVKVRYIVGDIKDKEKTEKIIGQYKPQVIFNAAAYKHVPLMELNPDEAVRNNIFGTKNLFESSIKHNVESFILISTDKAVNPTNVMGATKRVTEKMMHYYSKKTDKTKFMAVRFGNVLSSNGSVIPLFKKQIEEGVVTVTHKDITRYFMTIDEAVQLILQCWVLSKGDEIFVLDMGEPIKISNLAELMIRLSGKEPGKEVQIKYVGLRPGEKIYEEPLTKVEKTHATKNNKIFILSKDDTFDHSLFINETEMLILKSHIMTNTQIKKTLKALVPTYTDMKV